MEDSAQPAEACATCGSLTPHPGECPGAGDELIGLRLGEYEVRARLGQGGMGIVYEGYHALIGKRVAIKVLRPELSDDPVQVRRLLEEARLVNAIRHRSIVDVFSFGQVPSDGRHFLVMEYLEGCSLEQLIYREGSLPAHQVVLLLDEMLAGLGAAHKAGVIHRDIKASNVFIVQQEDGSRYVKLLDFGLAKYRNPDEPDASSTVELAIAGTPDYIAPEQARGRAVTPKTDLYSLGVVAYEMLTGQVPFRAPSIVELLTAHVQQPPPRPTLLEPSIPEELEELVLQLMAKSPDERPHSADAVRARLKRIARALSDATTQLHAKRGVARPEELPDEDAVSDTVVSARSAPPEPKSAASSGVAQVKALLGPAPLPIGEGTPSLSKRERGKGRVLLIISGAVGLGVLASLALRSEPPPPQPLPPPLPAPIAAPLPAKPEQPPPPVPEKSPPKVAAQKAPLRTSPRGPTRSQLESRIERLERELRASTPRDEEPDRTAGMLLSVARGRVERATSAADRAAISQSLDDWERKYLRQR